jgi:pyoverdine/dityrosine biosynthesis protein Dit1/alpha-ketoglutarate-dependent taurine dioxygenase
LPKVHRALLAGEPLHFVLPAFPAKSPSPLKTLGHLPDKAEELALRYLGAVCEELRALYPPGARITICSDGRVFNDLVLVSNENVTAYVQELCARLPPLGLHMIDHFDMGDFFGEVPFDEMRAMLTSRYAESLESLKERTRTEEAHRRLFNGIHRFLFEDRLALEPGKSRNHVRQITKDQALQVILRSNAWSRLIAEHFPNALRLSIHPQSPHSEKIGILLSEASDVWLTPWHSVALEEQGSFRLVRRREAEELGAQLVHEGDRPSHFVLPAAPRAHSQGEGEPRPHSSGGNLNSHAIHSQPWTLSALAPFGALVTARSGIPLAEVGPAALRAWVAEHRVLVLRGFAPLHGDALPTFCQTLGPLLEWSFGVVNHLQVDENAKNYLYTEHEVPFHWDGAFVGRIPHYIFFACDDTPPSGSGGETLFSDTTKLLARASPEELRQWEQTRITYTTEKVVHYGGRFTSPMIGTHPSSGERVLRFAEPVSDVNPVSLHIQGLPESAHAGLLASMRERLRDPAVCYAHAWEPGDMLIADNHALLHGRNAFSHPRRRKIRRVNISPSPAPELP